MLTKIKETIETSINPILNQHGGSCEFVSFENGVVSLKLKGACGHCPGATYTLKLGIERKLKQLYPNDVISVVSVK